MRRFFRFSVRDLLWLTLVVAVALGWLVRELHLGSEVARLAKDAEKWRIKSFLETGGLGSRGKPVSVLLEPDK